MYVNKSGLFYVECHTISQHKLKQFFHTKCFSVKNSQMWVQPSDFAHEIEDLIIIQNQIQHVH